MIKYASNAFLATRISYINEIANICEALGANVREVARGMGMDKRIGSYFLDAGLGWGGSCLPKDVKALAHMAESAGATPHLMHAVMEINQNQRIKVVHNLKHALGTLKGKRICVLGLSFKPNTDDTRDAPALDIIQMLFKSRASLKAFDHKRCRHPRQRSPNCSLDRTLMTPRLNLMHSCLQRMGCLK